MSFPSDLLFSEAQGAELIFGSALAAALARDGNLVFVDPPSTGELVFNEDETQAFQPVTCDITATLSGVTVALHSVGPVEANITTTLGGVTVAIMMIPPVLANVTATLGGVSVTLFAVTPVYINELITLGGVTAQAVCGYDNRVTWWKDTRSDLPHQLATANLAHADTAWQTGLQAMPKQEAVWEWADSKVKTLTAAAELAIPQYLIDDIPWVLGVPHDQSVSGTTQLAIPHEESRQSGWDIANNRRIQDTIKTQAAIFKPIESDLPWGVGNRVMQRLHTLAGLGIKHTTVLDFLWQTAVNPQPGVHLLPVVPPIWWATDLVFADAPGNCDLVFGDSDYITPGVVIPSQRVYMVTNDAALYRNGTLIPTHSMSLSLDVDSWTWGFGATLPATTLDSFTPSSNGAPVEVEAHINGVVYKALIESVSRSRSFGNEGLQISGRGKTALLDAPYAPVMAFSAASDRTAAQLLGDVLTVNGVPMGWDVTFGLEDWLIPANTFAHQGSYISALNAIAKAAGGYIQPHPSLSAISVLPLYPFLPRDWAWADYTLPSDLTVTEGISWVEKPRYNRVYVSGVQRGVVGRVTQLGTAGDILAPMVTDSLITTASAARQRGISVLGDTGRIATVSLTVPVLPATGIIQPGKMVKYTDNGVDRLGIVRSVNVDVAMPEIWQTLGVETHVN